MSPYSYSRIVLKDRLQPPSPEHPFGTDSLGRDLLVRIALATFISIGIALCVVAITSSVGLVLGVSAGYAGGWFDEFVMRLVDITLSFPGFLLALTVVAFLGPGLGNLILALSVAGWASYARLIRGETLKIREEDFVRATRALGASFFWTVRHHIVPHVLHLLLVQASLSVSGVILSESGLSFLGLGVKPPTPSLGAMLDEGRNYMFEAPWLTFFPGLFLFIIITGFILIGDGLRERQGD